MCNVNVACPPLFHYLFFCKNVYSKEAYNPVFDKLACGNVGARYILPIDLAEEIETKNLLELSLSWLYLHEQAHLFQSHGNKNKVEKIEQNMASLC